MKNAVKNALRSVEGGESVTALFFAANGDLTVKCDSDFVAKMVEQGGNVDFCPSPKFHPPIRMHGKFTFAGSRLK